MANRMLRGGMSSPMQPNMGKTEQLGTLSYVPNQRQMNHLNTMTQVTQYEAAKQMLQSGPQTTVGVPGVYSQTLG